MKGLNSYNLMVLILGGIYPHVLAAPAASSATRVHCTPTPSFHLKIISTAKAIHNNWAHMVNGRSLETEMYYTKTPVTVWELDEHCHLSANGSFADGSGHYIANGPPGAISETLFFEHHHYKGSQYLTCTPSEENLNCTNGVAYNYQYCESGTGGIRIGTYYGGCDRLTLQPYVF